MTVQLKKVEGGYELVIPDEVATQLGMSEAEAVELLVLSPHLLIWSPAFKKADWERTINGITPETLPDPYEPYPVPPALTRVEE